MQTIGNIKGRSKDEVKLGRLKELGCGKDRICLKLYHGLIGLLFCKSSVFLSSLNHSQAVLIGLPSGQVLDALRILKGGFPDLLVVEGLSLTILTYLVEAIGVNYLGDFFLIGPALDLSCLGEGKVRRRVLAINGRRWGRYWVYFGVVEEVTHRT